ncbi:MAG: hypothetical protein OHK0039_24170 [Bacteroidia bacterium]
MMRHLLIVAACVASLSVQGQDAAYRRVLAFAGDATLRGYGVGLEWWQGQHDRQWLYSLDMHLVRDLHEVQIDPFFGDQGRRYVYGKLNHFVVLAPSIGIQQTLMPRNHLNFVGLRIGAKVGPAIGLLNPYHLEIFRPNPATPFVGNRVVEAYDPVEHTYPRIIGRASLVSTQLDLSARIGLSVKGHLMFDFARGSQMINGIRLALHADLFPEVVPIMAARSDVENQRVFLGGSLGFILGGRW